MFFKKFGWWVSAKILKASLRFIRICPVSFLSKLGDGFGMIAYHLLTHRQKTGYENIKIAFGSETSKSEKKALIKANFNHISRDMLETAYCCINPQAQSFLKKNISVRGKEHLDRALKKGKGVIAISAHIGNFPIIGAKMATLGYSFWVINKNPNNPNNIYLIDLFRQCKDHLRIGFIPYKPRRVCVSESLKVLRNNGIIFLQIDQNPHKKAGTFVEFFGYQVPTYSGPVVMAFRTGAAIVPVFIQRNGNNTETITFRSEISLKRSKDRNQDIVDNLRIINIVCEDWIRKYPEQWWWIHRRFRRARKIAAQNKTNNVKTKSLPVS